MVRVSTEQLSWKVPADEWERFVRTVEERFRTANYAGAALSRAWGEYRDEHALEDLTDRLLALVGRASSTPRKEKPGRRTSTDEKETTRVWTNVPAEVKAEMKQYATSCGVPCHEVLRAVINWFAEGGLVIRVTAALEAVVDEAERLAADERGESTADKKARWLANYFIDEDGERGQFTDEDFGDALEAMPFRGGDTAHMREKWRPKVLDRLDMEPHPNVPGVYVTSEDAAEYRADDVAPDAPAIDRLNYDYLTDDERVKGLRIRLAQAAAAQSRQRLAWTDDDALREAFGGVPGTRKVRTLMDRAARAAGFETDVRNGKRLKVNLARVTDPTIRDHVDTEGPTTTEDPDDSADEKDVEAEANALMRATPTGGGN